MPNLTINGGGIISNSKNLPNLDLRYGPYDSLTDAYNSLIDYLVPGLVIGVFKEGGKVVEYQAQRVDGKIELLLKESDEIITNYDVLENHPKINNIELKGNKTNEQLGIPTKTSDLINDSGFSTSQQLNEKQDNLVSGVNIKTINDQSILGSGNIVVEGETDYTNLSNKPTINGHSLSGNLTAKDLGIINRVCLNDGTEIEPDEVGDVKLPIIPTSTSIIESGSNAVPTSEAVNTALETKQDNISTLTNAQPIIEKLNNRDSVIVIDDVQSLGYKILDVTKSFVSQVTQQNTVYEIRGKFDLNNETINLPDNITLKFNGGKLVNGTLFGNSVLVEAPLLKIFDNIYFEGGLVYNKFLVEWFVDIYEPNWTSTTRNSTKDASGQLTYAFNCGIKNIWFSSRRWYPIKSTIEINGGIDINTDLQTSYVGTSGSNNSKWIVEPCIYSKNVVTLVKYIYNCTGKTKCTIRGLNLYSFADYSVTSPEDWEIVKNTPILSFRSDTNVWGLEIDCQIQSRAQTKGTNKNFSDTEISEYASYIPGYTGINIRSNIGYISYVTIKGYIHGTYYGIQTGRYAENPKASWFTDVTIHASTSCVLGGILGAAPTTIYGSHQTSRVFKSSSYTNQYYWYSKGDIINRGFVWDLGDDSDSPVYIKLEEQEEGYPEFKSNTYYIKTDSNKYTLLGSKPNDWETNYFDYYYLASNKIYTAKHVALSDNAKYSNGGANYNQANGVVRYQYAHDDLTKDFIQLLPNKLTRALTSKNKWDYGIGGINNATYAELSASVNIVSKFPASPSTEEDKLYVLKEDADSFDNIDDKYELIKAETLTSTATVSDATRSNDYFYITDKEILFGTNLREKQTYTGNSTAEPNSRLIYKTQEVRTRNAFRRVVGEGGVISYEETTQSATTTEVSKVILGLKFSSNGYTLNRSYLYIGGFRGASAEIKVEVIIDGVNKNLAQNAFYFLDSCYAKFPFKSSTNYEINIICTKQTAQITRFPLPTIYIPDTTGRYITTLTTEQLQENEQETTVAPQADRTRGSRLIYNSDLAKMVTWNNNRYIDTLGYTMATKYGQTTKRPTVLTTTDVGFCYFDTTLGKPVWWNGYEWKDLLEIKIQIPNHGTTENRPTDLVSESNMIDFQYFDGDLNTNIWWNGIIWTNYKGDAADGKGTLLDRLSLESKKNICFEYTNRSDELKIVNTQNGVYFNSSGKYIATASTSIAYIDVQGLEGETIIFLGKTKSSTSPYYGYGFFDLTPNTSSSYSKYKYYKLVDDRYVPLLEKPDNWESEYESYFILTNVDGYAYTLTSGQVINKEYTITIPQNAKIFVTEYDDSAVPKTIFYTKLNNLITGDNYNIVENDGYWHERRINGNIGKVVIDDGKTFQDACQLYSDPEYDGIQVSCIDKRILMVKDRDIWKNILTSSDIQVHSPEIIFDDINNIITITCNTEESTIYYKYNESDEFSVYSDPLSVSESCVIYAKATKDGLEDSIVNNLNIVIE